MLSGSRMAGLPSPVSPFGPNLDALKLDISDGEDELEVEGEMEKLWADSADRPPESPASGFGIPDLGTPLMHNQVEFSSDGESPPYPSPRPRASTLAQSTNSLDSAAPLPTLSTNRQFLRAASQPINILGGLPILSENMDTRRRH